MTEARAHTVRIGEDTHIYLCIRIHISIYRCAIYLIYMQKGTRNTFLMRLEITADSGTGIGSAQHTKKDDIQEALKEPIHKTKPKRSREPQNYHGYLHAISQLLACELKATSANMLQEKKSRTLSAAATDARPPRDHQKKSLPNDQTSRTAY